nr:hypothetical protein DWF04_16690 [Cereibacter sphaeroides f. sp. denitrificans]
MPRSRNVARRPPVPPAAEPPPPDGRSGRAGDHPFGQRSGMPRLRGPPPPARRRPAPIRAGLAARQP